MLEEVHRDSSGRSFSQSLGSGTAAKRRVSSALSDPARHERIHQNGKAAPATVRTAP
jgi:hypothetical protein